MNMKTKYMIFIFAVLITSVSCSLDETIYDSLITENSIKSDQDLPFRINGIYGILQNYDCFKSNLNYQILFAGDDIATTHSIGKDFTTRGIFTTSGYLASPWRSFYSAINNANYLIGDLQKLESGVVSETAKKKTIGECQFLRAFSYFYLVRMYGGVPIKTLGTTGESEFYLKRDSIEAVYTLIFNDFKDAVLQLPLFSKQSMAERGRATKGSAHAMLSLAYLTYANYQDLLGQNVKARLNYQLAKNYADSVILSNEYKLVSNYADLFDVSKEVASYNEVIFAIQQTRDSKVADAASKGSELAWVTQPSTRYNVCGNISNSGKGAGTFQIQPWFYDVCSTGDYVNDYRTKVSFLTRWLNGIGPGERITYPEIKTSTEVVENYPYLNKYVDSKGLQTRNNENDFYIIRLSEVYLIKAEAENELNGPTTEAYTAFNKLRERARLANGTPVSTPANLATGLTKEQFRMKIFDERGLELVGEGHRWFDAVRMRCIDNTRTMIQYIHEDILAHLTNTSPSYNSTTKTWGGGRVNSINIAPFSSKFLIWPIPSQEIDANPNMVQSQGW